MLCFVKKRNKVLKTDFPVCLLPALECLNGTMDETLYPNPDPQKTAITGFIWRTKSHICVPITAVVYICNKVPWFSFSWILKLYEVVEHHILKNFTQQWRSVSEKNSTFCQVMEYVSYNLYLLNVNQSEKAAALVFNNHSNF